MRSLTKCNRDQKVVSTDSSVKRAFFHKRSPFEIAWTFQWKKQHAALKHFKEWGYGQIWHQPLALQSKSFATIRLKLNMRISNVNDIRKLNIIVDIRTTI